MWDWRVQVPSEKVLGSLAKDRQVAGLSKGKPVHMLRWTSLDCQEKANTSRSHFHQETWTWDGRRSQRRITCTLDTPCIAIYAYIGVV